MKRACGKAALLALLAPALALTSCQSIEFDLAGVDRPVVLGDRLHVGPKQEFRLLKSKDRRYKAEVYKVRAASAGSSSRQVGGMVETTSYSARDDWSGDNSRAGAARLLSWSPNSAIRRCRFEAYNWFINGLMALSGKTGLKVEGDVVHRYGNKGVKKLAQKVEAPR